MIAPVSTTDVGPVSIDDLAMMFERMILVREFEALASVLYRDGEIPGFLHLSMGQEACAVGACWPLRQTDVITSTHRGHGHCLAKGLDPADMFAELMGRSTGSNRGRGGSMHIADPALGVLGANGIVAAGIPIAVGAALARRLEGTGDIAVAFFGDGAVASGAFHESVNLASLWKLPIVFFCENNGFAEFSATADQHPVSLAQRAEGYGIRHVYADGNDVVEVARVMSGVVAGVREGSGPVLVEAATCRWHGHYVGDPQRYRDADENKRQREDGDPIVHAERLLISRGMNEAAVAQVRTRVADRLDAAVEHARRAAAPSPDSLYDYVVRADERQDERHSTARVSAPADNPDGEVFRYMDGVREALLEQLGSDDRVLLTGIDVGDGGNVFGLTRGLKEQFPDRVLDTPISEVAIMGLGVGSALLGYKPVVEIMYLDFIGVCFDQIMNQAAKFGFMSGGKAQQALTIRTQFGAGRSSGAQHSQSLEALLAHIPGLKVVMPSTPADTYGLLRASIQDPNPVVFIEHRLLYGLKGPKPPSDHLVPIGVANVVREGRHLTIVSYSRMVHECVDAATRLAERGIEAEVIDLRTVAPIDYDTVLASVRKTGRALIVHEAVGRHGLGAEISATIVDRAFWHLDAPIRRIGAAFTPAPYAPDLEKAWLPGHEDIVAEALRLMGE